MKKTHYYTLTIHPTDAIRMKSALLQCDLTPAFDRQPDYNTRTYYFHFDPAEIDLDQIIDQVQSIQWLLNRLQAIGIHYKIKMDPETLQLFGELQAQRKIKFYDFNNSKIL